MEYMPDVMVDTKFAMLSLPGKKVVLGRMAEIVDAIQKYPLPNSIKAFGGLSFDKKWDIVSVQMILFKGGPFDSYEELYKARILEALREGDEKPVLKG